MTIGLAYSFQEVKSIPINNYDIKLDFIITEKKIKMRILFLGDVVGISGCSKLTNNLLQQIDENKIDFVIVNAENAAEAGVGLTKEICEDFLIVV